MLFNVLPYLAIAGLAAESVSAKPHHGNAARHRVGRRADVNHGVKLMVRGTTGGAQKRCRVRPTTTTAAQAAPTTASVTTESSATTTANSVSTPSPAETTTATSQAAEAATTESTQAPEQTTATTESWTPTATLDTSNAIATGGSVGNSNIGNNKKGMIWPNGDWEMDIRKYSGFSWYWSWEHAASGWAKGTNYVPQYWGPGKLSQFQDQQANNWQGQSVTHVMFFNEPDLQDSSLGSGTDPAAAVDDWINNYAPLRDQGYKLGSAAPCGRNHEWTKQFESACQARGYGNRCLADFITTHVYAATVDDFIASVTNTYNLNGQRPVWVTEYACHDFNGKQCADPAAFVAAVGQWMDQQPWVERYSIFGAISDLHGVSEQNALMNPWSPYDPTSLWWTYVSA